MLDVRCWILDGFSTPNSVDYSSSIQYLIRVRNITDYTTAKMPGFLRNITICCLVLGGLISGCSTSPDPPEESEPVWADEFDGPAIDASKWEFQLGDGSDYGLPAGWGNNELQFYQPENATIENGRLVVTAREEAGGTHAYTSARLRSLNKGDWKYGRFEIRAKLPSGQGIWPAIWMLPSDNTYGGWAASGELDIMEMVGHEPATVHGTLHYGGSWPENTSTTGSFSLPSGDFSDKFHDFAIEWEEGEIRWYVDGSLYQTQTEWWSAGGDYPAPFNQRFHLLINLAIGGNWPGPPDSSTVFPQRLEVEYVRVYHK